MSTTELPTKNGIYWYQLDPRSRADIVQVDDGNVYYIGEATPLSLAHHTVGKFLGPVSVSDFEELAALRKTASEALQWIIKAKQLDHGMFHRVDRDFEACNEMTCKEAQALVAALREALGDSK